MTQDSVLTTKRIVVAKQYNHNAQTYVSSPCLPPSTDSTFHSPEFEEDLPSVDAEERLGTLNGRPADRVAHTGLKDYNWHLTLVRGTKRRKRGKEDHIK